MTKLTPARKALLQKLVNAGGEISWGKLTHGENHTGGAAVKAGLCKWVYAHGPMFNKDLRITDAGRAALQNEVK